MQSIRRVASHAEAWIETRFCRTAGAGSLVASHAEAWIETYEAISFCRNAASRLPRGGVD